MPERNGQRKTRNQLPKRKPELGYYYIVTDTEETEKNFLLGLQNSMPEYLQRKLIIKVVETWIPKNWLKQFLKIAQNNPSTVNHGLFLTAIRLKTLMGL